MRKTLGAIVLAGWLIFGGCATDYGPRATELAADRVDLPTTEEMGYLCIEMRVNGAGPFRFVVDTGSNGLFISEKVARAAGLADARTNTTIASPAGQFPSRVVTIERVESAGMTLRDVSAVVMDPEQTRVLEQSLSFDGLAGIGLFRDLILELNFPVHEVSVLRREPNPFPGASSVSYRGEIPLVTLQVAGKPVRAIVDSGSNFSLIVPHLEAYPLAIPIALDDGQGGAAIGSKDFDREENSQLKGEARWGPVRWVDPPLRRQHPGDDGNIGTGVLSRLNIALDARARRIYFVGGQFDCTWQIKEGTSK